MPMYINSRRGDLDYIYVSFNYSPEKVKKVKSLEGRVWSWQEKA